MLATSHALTGTLLGFACVALLVTGFAWAFLRSLDATNGINRNRKDQDSDA